MKNECLCDKPPCDSPAILSLGTVVCKLCHRDCIAYICESKVLFNKTAYIPYPLSCTPLKKGVGWGKVWPLQRICTNCAFPIVQILLGMCTHTCVIRLQCLRPEVSSEGNHSQLLGLGLKRMQNAVSFHSTVVIMLTSQWKTVVLDRA